MSTRGAGTKVHVALEVLETVRMRLWKMGVSPNDSDRVALTLGLMLCDERFTKEEAVGAADRFYPKEDPRGDQQAHEG